MEWSVSQCLFIIIKATMGSSSLLDEHITTKYEIKRRIGKGAYGIVWKAIDRTTNQTVAIKKIFDAFLNETDAQRTFREIMFLREFRNHANIVRLLDIHRATNDDDIYLIFEYMETDLHKLISKTGLLRDLHKRFIMYQLLRATFYIHSGNVIHRDQKPSNILVDSACRCKVADFGLARSLSSSRPTPGYDTDPALTDYVATRWYRAPEILVASQQYTKGVDMWSLGCILAEMLLGRPLFPGSSTINQVEHIISALNPPSASDLEGIDASYGSSLLSRPPSRPRKPLSEMLRGSPPDAIDLVTRLLVLNPHKRLTAAQALNHPYVAKYWRNVREPTLARSVVPILCDHVQLSAAEYRDKLYELIGEGSYATSPTNTSPSHRCHRSSTQTSKPASRPESGVKVKVSAPAFPVQPYTSTQRATKGPTPQKVLSRYPLSRQSTSDPIVAPTKPRGHSDPPAPPAPRRHSRTEMPNARVGSSNGHREKNWVSASFLRSNFLKKNN